MPNIGLELSHHCSFIHTFITQANMGLTHTVTHTLTHHSFYKSSVKVENDNIIHIKYLILM